MFATIYLPNFYLQAAIRHQPQLQAKPIALIDDQEAKALIIQLNQTAQDAGVRIGMAPSQGLARSLDLAVKTRDRAQEKLLDAIVIDFALTLAPYVEATAPGTCTVQFTDARNLEPKLVRLIEQLAQLELTARAGIALTPDASLLAAHLAKPILLVEDAKKFLAPLPIKTLVMS